MDLTIKLAREVAELLLEDGYKELFTHFTAIIDSVTESGAAAELKLRVVPDNEDDEEDEEDVRP